MAKENKKYDFYILVMEYAWLTIAIASLVTAVVNIYYHTIDAESIKFLVLFLLAFVMYLYRRYRRKKEKQTKL